MKKHTFKEVYEAGGYKHNITVDHHSPFGEYSPEFKSCILNPSKHPFYNIIEAVDPYSVDLSAYPIISIAEQKGMEKSFATIDLEKFTHNLMKSILATVPYEIKKELSNEYLKTVLKSLFFLVRVGTGAQGLFVDMFFNYPIKKPMKKLTFAGFRNNCLIQRKLSEIELSAAEKKFEDEYIHLTTQEEVDFTHSLSLDEALALIKKHKTKLVA